MDSGGKMRFYHIIGILILLIFVSAQGCQKAEAPAATQPTTTPTVEGEEPIPEPPELPTGADVRIGRSFFDPITTEIKKGATVTWKNTDDRAHMIKVVGTTIVSPRIESGDIWEQEFDEPGTYEMVDLFFGFKGYVVVSE